MKRVTFGVTSPFLASQVIKTLSALVVPSHPVAASGMSKDFYVDDLISGAATVDEARTLRIQICDALLSAGMTLKKCRTNSLELRHYIPKILGIHWDVTSDTLHVETPPPTVPADDITKRMVASGTARVYDIISLFSPSIVPTKILLQELWKLDLAWDKPISYHLADQYRDWIQKIPSLTSHPVPRRLSSFDIPVIFTSLHGFSDASQLAYGAAVYLRRIHANNSTHCTLLCKVQSHASQSTDHFQG